MKKPNIVFVLADDMGSWSLGCAGDTDINTPVLDSVAECGIRFENFFCTSPVCSPARASIMTGKMPSQHGIHDWLSKGHINYNEICEQDRKMLEAENCDWQYEWPRNQLMNDSAVRYIEGFETYTDMLSKNGYECALSGKWHLGDAKAPQHGFDYWKTTSMGGENYYYPLMLQNGEFKMLDHVYITDYITDNAIEFLSEHENKNSDKPFYLSVHYTSPHAPWDENQHPEQFYKMYENTDFPSMPDLPPHKWGSSYTKEQRIKRIQGYNAAVSAMDNQIGRLIEKLKAMDEWENTVFIFTADNGMSMGHHGIFGKGNGTFPMNLYDSAVKIPMIIAYPKQIKKGIVANGLYSHYDILPTIANMLGIELDKSYPGQSLLSLINGEDEKAERNEIVVFDEYGPARMIRTKTHKYVHRYPYGPHEFYDLVNDPDEENNLVGQKEYNDIIASMRKRLEDWFIEHSTPKNDGKSLEVYGIGQNARVGEGKVAFNVMDVPDKNIYKS